MILGILHPRSLRTGIKRLKNGDPSMMQFTKEPGPSKNILFRLVCFNFVQPKCYGFASVLLLSTGLMEIDLV